MLSQKAEETLTEFAAVKKADIQLQTTLGNRKGQIAANVIGAFAESQNSAFGWQVRAFSAKDNGRGANAGIFFRRVDGESLYGINSFVDYEKGKYGDFLRYGIGGELQNRYVAFAANLYLPITDDKHNGATVAFSQEGYDANLRINIPQLDFLKVRADYYHYSGEYGVENDKGLRYGLEVQPIANLRIGAFYDDGGEKFGGDIAYVYNIAPPQKRESNFAPDLFSPVLREYSQRISIAETTPFAFITTAMTTTRRITTSAMTTTIFSTMVGLRTTTYMTAAGMTATRMASVHFTLAFNDGNGDIVATTGIRFLITLPPLPAPYPIVITSSGRDWDMDASDAGFTTNDSARIIASQDAGFPINSRLGFGGTNLTATIRQGSEQFVSVAITLTTGTTRMTAADVITESGMMIMTAMTTEIMMTTFTTTRITITATTGAAKVDSHLPPSFPPSSFPLSFPQVPKLALAANLRISPSFPPPPTRGQAAAGIQPRKARA